MLRCGVLFLVAGLAFARSSDPPKPPQWAPEYIVEGVIFHPLSEIKEPFKAWYDGTNLRSRYDFYNGTSKSFNLHEDGNYEIYPITTQTEENSWTCDFYSSKTIRPVPALLNLEHSKLVGSKIIYGAKALEWQYTIHRNNVRSVLSMWVLYLKAGEKAPAVPLKFEFQIFDTKKGTLKEHTIIEYTNYQAGPIDYQFFDPAIVMNNRTGPIPPLHCRAVPQEHLWNPLEEFMAPHHNRHVEEFVLFKEKHGRNYLSEDEHEKRLDIFRHNLRIINSHNRAGHGYWLAVNHLADRTPEELASLLGVRNPLRHVSSGLPFPYSDEEVEVLGADVPEEHDWRLYGAVTPVKNQAQCGSCWAFSTVGAVEGALFLHSQDLVRLSEQAVIDCSWGYGPQGCNGGWPTDALNWMIKHGLPTYEAYGGYLGRDGVCHIANVTKVADVEGYVTIPPGNKDALKLAIFKSGPVSVCIQTSGPQFYFYSHGLYSCSKCDPKRVDHAVLAIGFGVLNDQAYWLIKNSWGPQWGSEGYMLMSAQNGCCIESLAVYPKIKT